MILGNDFTEVMGYADVAAEKCGDVVADHEETVVCEEFLWSTEESRLCEMEIGCAARKKLSGGSPEVPEPSNQLS